MHVDFHVKTAFLLFVSDLNQKSLQKIFSMFTKILLVVAQLFRAHGRDHADSRYLLRTTMPWAEF